MNKRTRVLAIGLDSADFDLIWKLKASGSLPNIQSLLSRGIWGRLQSPPGLGDDGVWASFSFAVEPGCHGRYFWQGFVPSSLDMKRSPELAPEIDTFWTTLSAEGYKVGVIDVPKSPLAELTHGIQVADWLVHGRDGKTRSYPADIAPMLVERFGCDATDDYESGAFLCCENALPAEKQEPFFQALLQSLENKRQASLALLSSEDWDLFITVFKESHCIGHEFWHSADASHERHHEGVNTTISDPVEHIYRCLDNAVGDLIRQADENTTVIVFSGLGMAANYTAEHCLDDILVGLEKALPPILEEKIRTLLPLLNHDLKATGRLMLHMPHNEMSGAIKFNIASSVGDLGLEQRNIISQWCDWLELELLALVNPNNGNAIVRQVVRSEECFSGDRLNMLPDLFVIWERSDSIDSVESEMLGVLHSKSPVLRSGNHIADGFYIMAGPAITERGTGKTTSIVDLGPTMAELLGSQTNFAGGKSILDRLVPLAEPECV